MEKLLYSLWKTDADSADGFRDRLLGELGPTLCALPQVHGLSLCVADSAVDAASGRRIAPDDAPAPLPDAVLSLWVDAASAAASWEPALDACVSRRGCYLVTEAEPLVHQETHPTAPGERVHGMCQVAFLRSPENLERQQWLRLWKDEHTPVAIDTQATFGYRQNLVVEVRGEDSAPWHAVVEENFPPQAMADDHAFYDTGGDPAVLREHSTAMFESCMRFIDMASIEVVPMSEYVLKSLRAH